VLDTKVGAADWLTLPPAGGSTVGDVDIDTAFGCMVGVSDSVVEVVTVGGWRTVKSTRIVVGVVALIVVVGCDTTSDELVVAVDAPLVEEIGGSFG